MTVFETLIDIGSRKEFTANTMRASYLKDQSSLKNWYLTESNTALYDAIFLKSLAYNLTVEQAEKEVVG